MKRPCLALLLCALAGCDRASDTALFRLHTPEASGIAFANTLLEDDSVYNPLAFDYLYNGAGVAIGDVNNDGLPDVYFAGNMVSSRLYLNRGEMRFADVTEAAAVGTQVWATGVSLVDINADGLLDIYVSVAGKVDEAERANLLFVNAGVDADGIPRFEERAREFGLADTGYTTHATFFDYDLDGDLDLYLLTNALEEYSRNLIRPRLIRGEARSTDRLYRNEGNGTFTNVSADAGILIEGYGLGVVVSDINRDGWPDVYVANDFHSNDLLWINNQNGTFTNRAAEYFKHQAHNAMGVDAADINNDDLVDVVVLDMLPEDNFRQKMMLSANNYDRFSMSLSYGFEPQYMRNMLQLNNGPGPVGTPTFSEIGQLAGVHNTDWSWAPLLADFDNDGLRDLFISNGYRRDVTNLDFVVYSQQTGRMGADERRSALFAAMRELPEVKVPNYLYRNRGDLTFEDVSDAWGVKVPSFSSGAAYADLDLDGDLDLVVSNIDEPAFVLENRAERLGRNHLRVALEGPPGNRGGHGTRVVIHAGGVRQSIEHTPYRGYKSTVESTLHFGLGEATSVESLEVFWPDGAYQRLTGLEANRLVTVGRGDAAGPAPSQPRQLAHLFTPALDLRGLDYVHQERKLADFKHTPLLPHKLSTGNPGVAVGDVDGNGLDDVYVGTDRGVEKEIFLQTAPARFSRRLVSAEDAQLEDMGALLFDADGDADLDLYVVSGGGFPQEGVYQDRLYLNDGGGVFTRAPAALPQESSSGSSVVAADYDGDGDLDLFVGGRVIPGQYPLPARSLLLRNDSEGGRARFTDATDEIAPQLADLGLVTAALWTDFDQDGAIDLLVAGEWMPLTFLRNRDGRFVDATPSTGLPDSHGWWNSLAAGDFDDDGDTDYLAGNRGLNSAYRGSPEEPVRVHAADFDGNGSVDPVLSRFIQGRSHPVASRDILIDQIIGMKGRFPRYEQYATATLEQTLSAEELERAYVGRSVNFASSFVENLGGGRFAIRDLPTRAQFAPVFGMMPADYDDDGNLDVLLVGNSRAPEVQSGWFDASVGTVLLGDGAGGFVAESGSRSGFFVDGDAKGIARLSLGGGRSAVLVTQNDDSLRAFTATRTGPRRLLRLRPDDAFARIILADGSTRRQEFHYGSTYLSQSSRYAEVPADAREVVVYDFAGRSRVEDPPVPREDS
jgi:enediyne biosynthesis protein E4